MNGKGVAGCQGRRAPYPILHSYQAYDRTAGNDQISINQMGKLNITVDRREQNPLPLNDTVIAEIATLSIFDYALKDDDGFAIERKSLGDFIQSVAIRSAFSRELRKLQRSRNAGFPRLIYVLECDFQDIESFDFARFSSGRVHAGLIHKRIRQLIYTHNVHLIFAGSPEGAARMVELLLKSRKEQLEGKAIVL